jgi:hypothetical protein
MYLRFLRALMPGELAGRETDRIDDDAGGSPARLGGM